MKRPRAHTFRGNRYRIVWHKPKRSKGYPKHLECWGTCSHPRVKGKRIVIWPKLRNLKLLQVLTDEAIHACAWDLDNEAVEEMSMSISSFLWRNGLRFI